MRAGLKIDLRKRQTVRAKNLIKETGNNEDSRQGFIKTSRL